MDPDLVRAHEVYDKTLGTKDHDFWKFIDCLMEHLGTRESYTAKFPCGCVYYVTRERVYIDPGNRDSLIRKKNL